MDEAALRDALAVERTRLANERTLLAYVRTAIAIAAAGLLLPQLYPQLRVAVPLACILALLGLGTLCLGVWRSCSVRHRLKG